MRTGVGRRQRRRRHAGKAALLGAGAEPTQPERVCWDVPPVRETPGRARAPRAPLQGAGSAHGTARGRRPGPVLPECRATSRARVLTFLLALVQGRREDARTSDGAEAGSMPARALQDRLGLAAGKRACGHADHGPPVIARHGPACEGKPRWGGTCGHAHPQGARGTHICEQPNE